MSPSAVNNIRTVARNPITESYHGNLTARVETLIKCFDQVVVPEIGEGGRACFIYLIAGAGLVKIGRSNNVASRFEDLQNSSPVRLSFVAAMRGTCRFERFIHSIYRKRRSHGEWFRPTPGMVQELARVFLHGIGYSVQRYGYPPEACSGAHIEILELLAAGKIKLPE